MTEYISKERAQDLIVTAAQGNGSRLACMLGKLEDEPPADVAPVVHAEWIGTWGDGYANGFIVYEEFECSRCGCVHHADGEPTWDYCPNCGARMGGGESDE